MLRVEPRSPAWPDMSPKEFKKSHRQQGKTGGQECGHDNIAGPMRAQIDSRVPYGSGDDEVKPATAAIEKSADRSDDHVVGDVTGWERWPGPCSILLIGKTNRRFPEQSEKCRIGVFELDQSNRLNLFRPAPANGVLQRADEEEIGNEQSSEQTKNKGASLESHKNQRIKPANDHEREPDSGIADGSHEQIENWIRPLFIDEMEKRLVQV